MPAEDLVCATFAALLVAWWVAVPFYHVLTGSP